MAAEASHAPSGREQQSFAAKLRQFFSPVEPWYNWGATDIFRINRVERDFSDESEGPGYYFEIQWLGLHLEITVGRTPPAITADQIIRNKAASAARAENRAAEGEGL